MRVPPSRDRQGVRPHRHLRQLVRRDAGIGISNADTELFCQEIDINYLSTV